MNDVDIKELVKKLSNQQRKEAKDELEKYPDPPGEEEYKGIMSESGEDLLK
jgi:hypothetical protein